MTKQEIKNRIDLLHEEILNNKVENDAMKSEILRLNDKLDISTNQVNQ